VKDPELTAQEQAKGARMLGAGDVKHTSGVNATVLLLISDPLVCTVFRETLERGGYVVVPTHDLGTALDWLMKSKPDLLVTRSYVSGMTGHDAAKYLRTKCPAMPVLIAGGFPDDDRIQYREALEGFDIFPKPYSPSELLEKVKEVLVNARKENSEPSETIR
jgi:DNA-binding response OmpR family regulator